MDRSNIGFALFLVLLLIAPGIPLSGTGTTASVSPAAVGLVAWFMLSPRLPVRVILSMPTLLALIGFSLYVLLGSLASGKPISIAYAIQYAFYTVAAGAMIPAYLIHRTRQDRQAEAWRILAWVGEIYLAGIIVSLWTGPLYQGHIESSGKAYGELTVPRGSGFAESVNAAAGIAAVFAALYLIAYRPSGRRPSFLLAVLGLAGLIATLSRSAIIAFAIAVCFLGVLMALRAVCVRGRIHGRLPVVPAALALLCGIVGVVSFELPIVEAAWQRLVLDQTVRWGDKPLAEQVLGSGFRSGNTSGGVFHTSHNFYIEALNDFGIIGVMIFVSILAVSLSRTAWYVVMRSSDRLSMFCVVGITTLAVHNMTQVFFYDAATLIFLILLLACSEVASSKFDRSTPIERR
jgi:hypothetical protein